MEIETRGMSVSGKDDTGSVIEAHDIKELSFEGPHKLDHDGRKMTVTLEGGGSLELVDDAGTKTPFTQFRKRQGMFLEGDMLDLGSQVYNFLGFHESKSALLQDIKHNTTRKHLLKDYSYGLVRKSSSITESNTSYYRVYRWVASETGSAITDEVIEKTSSWYTSDTFSNAGFGVTVVGSTTGSEYMDWTPSDPKSYPAYRYPGQMIYYFDQKPGGDPGQGTYISDGTSWRRIVAGPTSLGSYLDDSGDILAKTTAGITPASKLKLSIKKSKLADILKGEKDGILVAGDGVSLSTSGSGEGKKITISATGKDNYMTVSGKASAGIHGSSKVVEKVTQLDLSDSVISEQSVTASGTHLVKVRPAINATCMGLSEGSSSAPSTDRPVINVNVKGDASCSSISDGVLTIKAQEPILVAQNVGEMSSKFPADSNPERLLVNKDNETIFLSSLNSKAPTSTRSWKSVGYVGMPEQVSSLDRRFPEQLAGGSDGYKDEDFHELGYSSLSQTGAEKAGIPMPEKGVIHNIFEGNKATASETWFQKFYGFETGAEWSRHRKTQADVYIWSDWVSTAHVDNSCYSILVMRNDMKMADVFAKQLKMPYQLYQDPMANIKTVGLDGDFRVMRTGEYRIDVIAQFTAEKMANLTEATGAVMEIHAGNTTVATISHSKEDIYDSGTKEFYPIRGIFPKVKLVFGETYNIRVGLTNASVEERKVLEYDPYKNMVSIEPVTSQTGTGRQILDTLYNTMGGLSFTSGNEIRTERASDGTTVRVFGETYLTEFKELSHNG